MIFLIDGYNLLFRIIESKETLQKQRRWIIRSLQIEFKKLHLKGIVVFDGARGPEESGLAYHSPLVIAYSYQGQSADAYILEKIESKKARSEITVVTDDRFLTTSARALGVHTLNIRKFLKWLEGKAAREKKDLEERPVKESKRETARLLKIFGNQK